MQNTNEEKIKQADFDKKWKRQYPHRHRQVK